MAGGRPVSEQTLRLLAAIEQEYVRTRKSLTYEQWAAKLIEVGLLSEDYDPKNLRYTLQKARRQKRIPKSALLIPHEAKSEAIAVLASILKESHPMTVRQCFYALVTRGIIKNSLREYQRVSAMLTDAREKGQIPFDYIVDRTRLSYGPDLFANPTHFAESIRDSYRKNLWDNQDQYVELWTEKDASYGSVADLLEDLGVTVRIGKGYVSATKIYESAARLSEIDKPITIFYLGDFDASGVDIERDIYDRHLQYGSGDFTLWRLAITEEDVKTLDLPPQMVKESDVRAASFRAKYDNSDCYELDALPVDILRERITEAIMSCVDKKLWEATKQTEAEELKTIQASVGEWNKGPANHKQFITFQDGI
jgi:hypothetical protein